MNDQIKELAKRQYEADVKARPFYPGANGDIPRKTWDQLPGYAKQSWYAGARRDLNKA